jgi:hypothetical protein
MSLILRWFHDNGERHRVYFRHSDASDRRELVIAGRDWQRALPEPRAQRLEDLSEDTLVDLARRYRSETVDQEVGFR